MSGSASSMRPSGVSSTHRFNIRIVLRLESPIDSAMYFEFEMFCELLLIEVYVGIGIESRKVVVMNDGADIARVVIEATSRSCTSGKTN